MQSSKIQIKSCLLLICTILILSVISSLILDNINFFSTHANQSFSVPPFTGTSINPNSQNTSKNPLLSVQPFQQPQILFIVDNAISPNPDKDIPFYDFMTTVLNYNVTYRTSKGPYIYDNFDVIVISSSVAEAGTVDSLSNAQIPILTMQAGHYDEFQLGSFYSIRTTSKFYILDGEHFVSEDLISPSILMVYTDENPVGYIQDYRYTPEGVEINLIAVRSDKQGNYYYPGDATWVVLDKGMRAWDLSLAPERRAFWGAGWGTEMSSNGWNSWNRTLSWLLYNDNPGSATLTVEVTDLANKTIPNARVTLIDVNNPLNTWIQNTSTLGTTTFSNIPFGLYNATIEYEDTINTELHFLEVAGERTYDIEPELFFSVQIDEYSDNTPPLITNIHFYPSNTNFTADIFDESEIIRVNLSLTIKDSANGSVLRDSVYSMVSLDGTHFFNDTALQGVPSFGINVVYNISALDIASNKKQSENFFFTLGDLTAPIVHYYNVSDNEDGSLIFYANVTDEESLVQQVILRINNTYWNMYLNSSGLWIFETFAYYNVLLNYSIHSVADSVGNENNDTFSPQFGLIRPLDSYQPVIYDASYNLSAHEEGFVVFRATVEEMNEYQSGVNGSSVAIVLAIYNGSWVNDTYPLYPIGEITYEFDYKFNFNDTVIYRITASDFAGNINWGFEHIAVIDDNSIPKVTFNAQEFGNGTLIFNSNVIDWPDNDTTATLYYTQNYFGTWSNMSMISINDNLFYQKIHNFDYRLQDVWFYTIAIDSAFNIVDITPDQYQKIELSDLIAPTVFFTIENSSVIDGKISITSWANDLYGDVRDINNTFYINFTYQSITNQYEMEYDSFYFYTFEQTFNFGEEVTIKVWTTDNAGNLGKSNRTILINDISAPKIPNTGIYEYQNGTVTFWAEVIEYSTGSGLPSEHSSVRLEFVFISIFNETMSKNGSENIFTYTVSGFVPGNAFNYRISAYDNCNNIAITYWNMEIIEDKSPPIVKDFGYTETLINHSFSKIDFWVDAMDNFGPISAVEITIDSFNGTCWVSLFSKMSFIGLKYSYSAYIQCNCTFNYSILIYDGKPNFILVGNNSLKTYWGPVIIDAGILQKSNNAILIWANVSDWGSGVSEVILDYEFISQGGAGGYGADLQIETVNMDFNGSLYITILSFSNSGTITWSITAKDGSNTFSTSKSSSQPFFITIPTDSSISWEEYLPVIIAGIVIPLVLIFGAVSIRRRKRQKVYVKRQGEKEIAQRFTDVLSIRSIICRNKFGIAFYTENFLVETQDLDLTAGLTSAVSSLVTEVSKRAMKKGEFDVLEREGFSILSHHGEYSTISLVSEGRLSEFMKEKITKLHEAIEARFSQQDLEDIGIRDYPEEFRGLIYQHLNVGLLSKLTLDFNRFKNQQKQFTEKERKQIIYLKGLLLRNNGQIAFYVVTFTSSLTKHGVSLVKAYTLLEKCFRLKVIYPIMLEPKVA